MSEGFDRPEVNDLGGIKYDANKPDWSLLHLEDVEEIVKVMTFGAKKYGRFNWHKMEGYRYYAAAMRHLCAYNSGQQVDSETGLDHLAHAASCILFVMGLERLERDGAT